MRMLNRAIEDASDFSDMMRKIRAGHEDMRAEVEALHKSTKWPGESRQEYRARLRAEAKAKSKVRS